MRTTELRTLHLTWSSSLRRNTPPLIHAASAPLLIQPVSTRHYTSPAIHETAPMKHDTPPLIHAASERHATSQLIYPVSKNRDTAPSGHAQTGSAMQPEVILMCQRQQQKEQNIVNVCHIVL